MRFTIRNGVRRMNIPPGERSGSDCIVMLPSFVKDIVEAQYRVKSDKAANLTVGQWLKAQPDTVQCREAFRVLQKCGLVALVIGKQGFRDARG